MRRYWFYTLLVIAASAGLSLAQAPRPSTSAAPARMKAADEPEEIIGAPVFVDVVDSDHPAGAPAGTAGVSIIDAPVFGEPGPTCGQGSCGQGPWGCGPAAPPVPRFWAQAEYLLWWVRESDLPTVVGATPTSEVLSGPGQVRTITPLFGGQASGDRFGFDQQSGLRLSVGGFLDDEGAFGWDASYFQLETGTGGDRFASSGSPIIGPVFNDPLRNEQVIILASLPPIGAGPLAPGLRSAVIGVDASNRLWGAEMNLRRRGGALLFADQLDFLVGFRHLQYSEGLGIYTHSQPLAGNPGGTTVDTYDSFGVHNQFYGGQVGFSSRTFIREIFTVDVIGKLALGAMNQTSNIHGGTRLSTPGLPIASSVGGVLTQRTNIGRRSNNEFTFIPELTINAGVRLTRGVRLTFGYNFLYVGKVSRVDDLIDGVDSRAVRALGAYDPTANPTRPAVRDDSWGRFWVQGINAGLEFTY